MDQDSKAAIFQSSIEQLLGVKLEAFVFVGNLQNDDEGREIMSGRGSLEDQARLFADLFTTKPELGMAVMEQLRHDIEEA